MARFLAIHGVATALDGARGRFFSPHSGRGNRNVGFAPKRTGTVALSLTRSSIWLARGYSDIQGQVPDVVRFVRGAACAGGEEFAAAIGRSRYARCCRGNQVALPTHQDDLLYINLFLCQKTSSA